MEPTFGFQKELLELVLKKINTKNTCHIMHTYMLSPKALPASPLTLVTLSHSHPYPYYPKFLSIYQKHIITICTSSKPTPQPLSPQVFHLSAFSRQ